MSTVKFQESLSAETRATGRNLTGSPVGKNKVAQDVRTYATVQQIASDAVDSFSSGLNAITAASHLAQVGDRIRFTSGTLDTLEFHVVETDTNTISIAEDMPASPSPADTFLILRPISQTLSSTGTTSGTVSFTLDGVAQEVIKDTATPANSRPLPVEILSASGVEINVTTGDIGVQLSASGANPDSVRIGDGTETVNVNASNEMQVADDNARTSLSNMDGKLPAQGQALMAASVPVAIASNQSAIPASQSGTWNLTNISGTVSLPTGAATAANQATGNGHLSTLAGAVAGTEVQVDVLTSSLPTGAATSANQTTANSALSAIQSAVEILDNIVSGSEAQVDVITQAAPTGRTKVELIRNNYTSTNVTTGAYVELVASTSAAINQLQIFDSSGETLVLAVGAAASEVDQIYVFPGGNGVTDLAIAAGSRISVKAISASATSGELTINCLS